MKDFIQSTRALNNFTTVTAPVTTTLKSGNNDYIEEVLGIKQTVTNTDGVKQKQTSPDDDHHLTTERTILAKIDDTTEKESDYINGDANFLDEGSGAGDVLSTTILTSIVATVNSPTEKANSSPKIEENVLYDGLDEYIYGGDIEEDTTFEETTPNKDIKEDFANFNSTNNLLAAILSSLGTQNANAKQEAEIESSSATTDKTPLVKEVTPIEDYESSKSTDSSNLIIKAQDLLTPDYTKTALETGIETIDTSTDKNQAISNHIKEYNEEILISATTIPDQIALTEKNVQTTTNAPFLLEVEENVMTTIPTVLEKQKVSKQNFILDGVENLSAASIVVPTEDILTTVSEHPPESIATTYTSSALLENATDLSQSTTPVDGKTILENHTANIIDNGTDSAVIFTSKHSKEDATVVITGTEQTTITTNQPKPITSSTFVSTKQTSVMSINLLKEETEPPIAEVVATDHEEFYKEFTESTDNLPVEDWDDATSVTNYNKESTTQTNSAEDGFETTTTIIDVWLAEENITKNSFNDSIALDITTSLIGVHDEDTTDFATILTDDSATTKTFIQDIMKNTTTASQEVVLTEIITVPSDISTFPTETSPETMSTHDTTQLNVDSKEGDDNFTQLEYDFDDIAETSTKSSKFRKEKQMRDPDLGDVNIETSTSTTFNIETSTSYVEENTFADSQDGITTTISEIETVTDQIAPEFNLYEDNLTSTIFSKELTDNGQFTADAINILKENNYEITENPLLNRNDQFSTSTENNDNDTTSITENYDDAEDIIRNLEAELDNIREELPDRNTVKFDGNVSDNDEMRNEEDVIKNNIEGWTEVAENNITEAAIEEILDNIEEISADNKDNSVLGTSPLPKNTNENDTVIDIVKELIKEQSIKERNVSLITEHIQDAVMKYITNQTEEIEELFEQSTTTDINEVITTEPVQISEEETIMQTVSEMRIEDITEEIGKEYKKNVTVTPESTEAYQASTSGLGYNTEKITEESLFQKDAVITTDSVISSMQELEDLNSITSKRAGTLSSDISEDPTTKVVPSTNEEISTISKINIPFTSVYGEQEMLSKHVFKTYIDGTTTESIQVDLVDPISTQKSLLDLLRGENADKVEHTLTDRDTRVNLTALRETDWKKISLNELAEDKQEENEEEEEYKEDFEDEDMNKIKLLGEELINGKNISSHGNSVSPNYFDEDYTEEYNSSEVYSENQDDFTSYILTLPARKEDCIQGNISFRIFIGVCTYYV